MEEKEYRCICGKVFINSQSFNAHKSHCKKHQLNKYGNLDSLIESDKIRHAHMKNTNNKKKEVNKNNKLEQWIFEQHKCERCGKIITKYYGSGRFCSKSCANSRKQSNEIKNKISNKLKKKKQKIYTCEICGNLFINNRYKKTCSKQCLSIFRKQKTNKTQYELYKQQCYFNFNLYCYKDEFDIDLLKKYGMYSAVNRGNNFNGVSRDHMYSIYNGFINKIDPYIISHPANCKIIFQKDNAKKNINNSLTLQQLKDRIKYFNKKYGYFINNINYYGIEEFKNS